MIEMLDKKELLALLHKKCSNCGKVKYLGEFSKKKTGAGGVRSQCKSCLRECSRKWHEENRERSCENKRKWYEKNREKRLEQNRKWYEANSEKHNEKCRKWSKANRDKKRKSFSKWQKANPEKVREHIHRRRARMANAAGSFTAEQCQARLEYHGNRCIYCGCDGKMTIEHLIPMARGGTNWPANLAPSCQSCNSSKGAKTHFEFLEYIAERDRLSTTPTGEPK